MYNKNGCGQGCGLSIGAWHVGVAIMVPKTISKKLRPMRCTVTMESASDRRRRLAREKLQRCHLADLKLFFPLAFSHSRSPAYVRTALLVHVTMQIFVVVLVVVFFVVSRNWFFPANHKSVSILFLFTCILYCIAFLLLREAFLRMRIPSSLFKGCGLSFSFSNFCMSAIH